MALALTYRRRLRERALDQYGYVTTHDARALGIPAVELRKLCQRGGLEHIGHGIYRFDDVPRTGREQFMEAVLRAGPGSFLVRDAVLALHDLALANPRRIRVGVPQQRLPVAPAFVELERRTDAPRISTYEGIPATDVGQALIESRGIVMDERLVEAAREASDAGLLRRAEAERVIAQIGSPA